MLWPLVLALCCSGTKPKVVPKKPAQLCWVHIKLWECGTAEYGLMRQVYIQAAMRGEGSNWNKNPVWPPLNSQSPFRSYPYIGEIKGNMIHKSHHTPEEADLQGRKSRRKLKTLERERLWCTEPLIPATNPPLPGARCLWILSPGNRAIKGTPFPISGCQNLHCPSQQLTKSKFSMCQLSSTSLLTW